MEWKIGLAVAMSALAFSLWITMPVLPIALLIAAGEEWQREDHLTCRAVVLGAVGFPCAVAVVGPLMLYIAAAIGMMWEWAS